MRALASARLLVSFARRCIGKERLGYLFLVLRSFDIAEGNLD
jgi:hypothetical protein